MQGEILEKFRVADLLDGGRSMLKILFSMRGRDEVPRWRGPRVALTWDYLTGIPSYEESRGYPALVIELPAKMVDEVKGLAECSPEPRILDHLDWTTSIAALVLKGAKNTIELVAGDMFPLLRLSNQGCILAVFVCAGEVTVVEYLFNRSDFLGICAQVSSDASISGERGRADELDWSERCYKKIGRRHHWQPLINHFDDDERFYN